MYQFLARSEYLFELNIYRQVKFNILYEIWQKYLKIC